METIHIQKYIHTSPRKLRLLADMVRGMNPLRALDVLSFSYKAAGEDLGKAIKTALGNAKQLGLDQTKVIFKSLEVNESMKMRRFRAGTRGRAKPFKRRMAHIKIVLSDDLSKKVQVTSNKQEQENKKEKK